MGKRIYSAFGMYIRSEFSLALPLADDSTPTDWPVEIVHGPVPRSPELPYALGQIRYGRESDSIRFDIPWVARYSIEGDSRIVVEEYDGIRKEFVGMYLAGLLLAVLLRNRDVILLHGSAVVGSEGSLIFIGEKGSGKSTTAAAMAALGYRMLCDDVIPILPGPRVLPGIPFPRLMLDAYEKLIGDPKEAAHLFDGISKYHVDLLSSSKIAPLRMIFVLEASDTTELRVEPIKGAVKIHTILKNIISLEGIDDPVSLFTRSSERCSAIPCYRVNRPLVQNCLEELAKTIVQMDKKE